MGGVDDELCTLRKLQVCDSQVRIQGLCYISEPGHNETHGELWRVMFPGLMLTGILWNICLKPCWEGRSVEGLI